MAGILKKWNSFLQTPVGKVMEIGIYAVMVLLVCAYFTGNGQFVYENF